jgi:hypothetical protein
MENPMAKNKGGREIRKPKQPKKPKPSAETNAGGLTLERTAKKAK